ncbi:MAG: hypothetical protein IAF94_18425 [Pirellulaceae bacterium]|nr:hypothetical protein [Pirellulaceae bacterium]
MPLGYTTKEAGELLGQPEWLIRRVVDSLVETVPRFGGKRFIPSARLAEVAERVRERIAKRRKSEAPA